MKVTLPPVPRSLEKLRRFLDNVLLPVTGEEVHHIKLAVQEAATNYMKYADAAARGCPLEVDVRIKGNLLTVRIPFFCARGAEKDINPRDLDKVRPGGLGTHFIQEIMDRVEYECCEGRSMTLVLTRALKTVTT